LPGILNVKVDLNDKGQPEIFSGIISRMEMAAIFRRLSQACPSIAEHQ
jgi:hypothetical protein